MRSVCLVVTTPAPSRVPFSKERLERILICPLYAQRLPPPVPYCTGAGDTRDVFGFAIRRDRSGFHGIPQSCRTTLSSEPLILRGMSPLYSMKPSRLNLFRKKFTRDRVVPTISASVSCDTFGTARAGLSCFP